MLKKTGEFLCSYGKAIVIFLVLILLMPFFHVRSEPERTNYLPGEKQTWLVKMNWYESPLGEYLFHTDGNADVFIGIIMRDYVNNLIGIVLLFVYYLVASFVNSFVRNRSSRLGLFL